MSLVFPTSNLMYTWECFVLFAWGMYMGFLYVTFIIISVDDDIIEMWNLFVSAVLKIMAEE